MMLDQQDSERSDEAIHTGKTTEEYISQIHKNLDVLNQYYKNIKLENDNTSLVLKLISDLYKRVEELEKRTA